MKMSNMLRGRRLDDKYYVTISKGDKLLYSGKMSQVMKQE